jgi:hypothetical protein
MRPFKNCAVNVSLTLFICSVVVAMPIKEADIAKRTPGDANDPIEATFDVSNWQNIAEENCFAMLCLNDPPNRV